MYWKNFSCELLKTRLKRLKIACFGLLRSFLRGVLNRVFNTLCKTFHSTPCNFRRVKMELCRVFSCCGALFLSFAECIAGLPSFFGAGGRRFMRGKVFHSFPPNGICAYRAVRAGSQERRLSLCEGTRRAGAFPLRRNAKGRRSPFAREREGPPRELLWKKMSAKRYRRLILPPQCGILIKENGARPALRAACLKNAFAEQPAPKTNIRKDLLSCW